MTEHQRNLMFCVGVTLYTGFANLTMKHAPQLTAPIFASIDVGFLVWLLVKERLIRRDVVGGRLGIAIVSYLRGARSSGRARTLSPSEVAWILRTFDASGNGTLETEEVAALLHAQGIRPRETELVRLFREVDRDGDGRIDRGELASFLARGFATDVTREEELAYCFRRLDVDGDGRISADELREAALAASSQRAEALERLAQGVDRRSGAAVGYGSFASAVDSRRAARIAVELAHAATVVAPAPATLVSASGPGSSAAGTLVSARRG